jgi:hypothetical protein
VEVVVSRDVLSVDPVVVENPVISESPLSAVEQVALVQKQKNSAGWIFAIVLFTVVNSVLMWLQTNFSFLIGLGLTQIIDGVAFLFGVDYPANATLFMGIAVALNSAIVGLFVFLGIMARRRHAWAFIVTIVLYSLDLIFLVLLQEWFGAALHLYALFNLWGGFQATRTLNKHLQSGRVVMAATVVV